MPVSDPLADLRPREVQALLLAERSGPFIAYRDGAGVLHTFELRPEVASIVAGRGAGATLRLPWDSEVSGIHAVFQYLGGEWTVEDDNLSTNGTFLNAGNVKGRGQQRLRHDDRLRLGQTMLVYKSRQHVPVASTAVANDRPGLGPLMPSQHRILVALCRPKLTHGEAQAPATNEQIAKEVHLGVESVRANLRVLFTRYGYSKLAQNQKRAALAAHALKVGLVSRRDL